MDFAAHCLDCLSIDGRSPAPVMRFHRYDERAEWVGTHRVKTGHRVAQWIEGGGK